MSIRAVAAIAMLAALSGCASLSKSECEVGDWYAVGKTDGYNGQQPVTRIAQHNEACNRYGISVDQLPYNQGHTEGLRGYCTLQRGVSEGKSGRAYSGACQGQGDFDFRRGHTVGMEYHDIQSEINALRSSITYARSEQKKHKPGTPEYYQKDGDIRVNETKIQGLLQQQNQIDLRISNMLTSIPPVSYQGAFPTSSPYIR